MPKDYKNIFSSDTKTKKKANPLGYFLFFFIGFLCGLLAVASAYFALDFTLVAIPPKTAASPDNIAAVTKRDEIEKKQKKTNTTPKPQFDFYKILPHRKVDVSEWVVAQEKKEDNRPNDSIAHILQIGSFKKHAAAAEKKDQLISLGVPARIQRVVINERVRYRVRVGPYTSWDALQRVRKKLLENKLDFILLKLEVEPDE